MALELQLILRDTRTGETHGVVRREVPDKAAFKGRRAAEEVHFPFPRPDDGPLDAVVRILEVREFRRGLLEYAATMIGKQLADFLEDREGWHGIDRQETTDKIAREDF